MSRTTVIQIIAAVIFIAVMAGISFFLKWTTGFMTSDFKSGLLVGAGIVCVGFLIANRLERSPTFGRGQKQRPRDTIDL